jgi:hypothetical protein
MNSNIKNTGRVMNDITSALETMAILCTKSPVLAFLICKKNHLTNQVEGADSAIVSSFYIFLICGLYFNAT